MARQWLAFVPDVVCYVPPGLPLSGQGLPLFPTKAATTDAPFSLSLSPFLQR
jgi:hypothetical protein